MNNKLMHLPIIPDPMIELMTLKAADERLLVPPLFLGLQTRVVVSSSSSYFNKVALMSV